MPRANLHRGLHRRLFEDLLQECAPAVCFHLLRLELYPGRVALGWIASGFASFLPAEQTLILWDRIIGFVCARLHPHNPCRTITNILDGCKNVCPCSQDSLELLPILAAAIFVYRARWLLQANESTHAQRLLMDATGLRVIPLIQIFLANHNQLVVLQHEHDWQPSPAAAADRS